MRAVDIAMQRPDIFVILEALSAHHENLRMQIEVLGDTGPSARALAHEMDVAERLMAGLHTALSPCSLHHLTAEASHAC